MCGICVRTCDELVGAHALEFAGQGIDTHIAAIGGRSFIDSNCEFCGECFVRLTTVSKDNIIAAARMLATTKPATIVYSLGIAEHTHGVDNVLVIWDVTPQITLVLNRLQI